MNSADQIMESALRGEVELLAPELSKYECGNVSLDTAYSLPITFVSESGELAKETYSLAFNLGITYYDASFLSLAKKFDVTLVTENIKHQAKSKGIKVKSLREY